MMFDAASWPPPEDPPFQDPMAFPVPALPDEEDEEYEDDAPEEAVPGLSVGRIDFLNSLPVFWQPSVLPPAFTLVPGNPVALNRQLMANQLILSPVSSIVYLKHRDQLHLWHDLTVAARGKSVESVLLFLRKPLTQCRPGQTRFMVPSYSQTSVTLLRVLLEKTVGRGPWEKGFKVYEPGQEAQVLGQPVDGVLMIGDEALNHYWHMQAEENFGPWQVIDMGSWWYEVTGMPFVFAVWVSPKALLAAPPLDEYGPLPKDQVAAVVAALAQNVQAWRALDPEQHPPLIRQFLATKRLRLPPGRCRTYLQDVLTFNLTAQHLSSLTLFGSWAAALPPG
jgi:predicted solute-binding protein